MRTIFLKAVAIAAALAFQTSYTFAQCPLTNTCTPGNASNPDAGLFGGGIFQVKIGNTFTNTSLGQADGYKDYCSLGPINISLGSPTSISVKTGNTFNENVRVYVDLNNDETFTAPSELVYSSDGLKTHTGSFTLGSGTTGQRLKMRITSDQIQATVLPGPCTTPQYSQVEDYAIIITQNTNPPIVRFSVPDSITCNGNITFTDLTINNPTSWLWSFGDGQFSTDQSPVHVYPGSGSFTVKLKATNAFGVDSLTKTNYIRYNDTIPVSNSCQPITFNQCCGYGISKVVLGSINNTSGLGTYEDFTCSKRTTLLKGKNYPVSLETNANQDQDSKIYIDYNGNGTFETNELAFTALASRSPSGNILISGDTSVKLNKGLRMRVISEFAGAPLGPCTDLDKGQCEDYTVVIKDNLEPPIASFDVFSANFCLPDFTFTSTSQNSILTYQWFFGDGTDTIVSTPTFSHTYSAPGSYTVKLKVTGPYGEDTITKVGVVNYLGAPVGTCSLVSQVGGPNNNPGIAEVTFGTIVNRTGPATQGYQDYSCTKQTNSRVGQSMVLTVKNSSFRAEKVQAWIDWNGNGQLETTERVMNTTNDTVHSVSVIIPGNAILGRTLRMRIVSNLVQSGQLAACGTVQQGQGEDYGVVVLPNNIKPATQFGVNSRTSCTGVIQFLDSSQNIPTSYLWSFGDGQTSTLASPSHTYTTTGLFTVKLKTSNAFGSDSITKTNYITISAITGLLPTTCLPVTTQPNQQFGIGRVIFAGIDKVSGNSTEGNMDFTCGTVGAGTLGGSLPIQVLNSGTSSQAVGVWIDFNNDATFTANESVFTTTGGTTHAGTVTIPANAVAGTGLRVRVKADVGGQTITGPCASGFVGQYEDYQIILQANNQKPKAFFKADNILTCTGLISFSDTSFNAPTSWRWYFGDGDSSTLRNPTHQYNGTGSFSVKLITSNSFGSDTVSKTNYITVQNGENLKAAPCTPLTTNTANNPGVGITNVKFNTINRTSATAPAENYVDASCQNKTTLVQGQAYSLAVLTNQNFAESCRAWIDWNNNGQFEDPAERVLNGTNNSQHIASVTVPLNAKLDTVLRLRIMSDAAGGGPGGINLQPCVGPTLGQCEDYGVKVVQNTSKPIARISNVLITACNPTVQFTDSSMFVPTSWEWSFGDGNTSTLKNPIHTYFGIGTYSVKLKVTNIFGKDSVTIPNYVTITGLNGPKPASCTNKVVNPSANLGISRVRVGTTFDKTTLLSLGDGGSKDFSCTDTMRFVTNSGPINFTVNTSSGNQREDCQIYIDLNNDGVFSLGNERIMASQNNNIHTINRTFTQLESIGLPVRMRVISDFLNFNITGPCYIPQQGQAEDYTIRLVWLNPNATKPIAKISNVKISACNPSIQFRDSSFFSPTSWQWFFGDGNTSNDTNPVHVYAGTGTYTVKLKVSNSFGSDSVTIPNYVTITGLNGPKQAPCTNKVVNPSATLGITRVRVGGTFDKTTLLSQGDGGSKDFSCTDNMEFVTNSSPINFTVNTSSGNFREDCVIYIDLNNDGIFSEGNEKIMNSQNNNIHTIDRSFTQVESIGLPVRMRVISDFQNFTINGPCYTPQAGQAEDYSIRLGWEVANSEIVSKNSFVAYPNPGNGIFNLNGKENIKSVLVTDMQGKILAKDFYTKQMHDKSFDLSNLPNGIYTLHILSEAGPSKKQIIIQK